MVFTGGVRWCCGRRLDMWGPLVRLAGHATWSVGQVSSLHRLWAMDTLSTTSARHLEKQFLEMHQHMAGWPHLGLVELVLCAMSFPHVILSVTMPYFGHNEDMHGFWSI
jgi:hypothetical protein